MQHLRQHHHCHKMSNDTICSFVVIKSKVVISIKHNNFLFVCLLLLLFPSVFFCLSPNDVGAIVLRCHDSHTSSPTTHHADHYRRPILKPNKFRSIISFFRYHVYSNWKSCACVFHFYFAKQLNNHNIRCHLM